MCRLFFSTLLGVPWPMPGLFLLVKTQLYQRTEFSVDEEIILFTPVYKKNEVVSLLTPSFLVQRENNCFTNSSPTKKNVAEFHLLPPPRMQSSPPGWQYSCSRESLKNPSFVTGFLAYWVDPMDDFPETGWIHQQILPWISCLPVWNPVSASQHRLLKMA